MWLFNIFKGALDNKQSPVPSNCEVTVSSASLANTSINWVSVLKIYTKLHVYSNSMREYGDQYTVCVELYELLSSQTVDMQIIPSLVTSRCAGMNGIKWIE